MSKTRSLSDWLSDAQSPLRAYISTISPRLESTRGGTLGARMGAASVGFADIAASELRAPRFPDADPGTAGTAFDYLTRMLLPGFDLDSTVATLGVDWLKEHAAEVREGLHWARTAEEWFDEARQIIVANGDLDRAALLLAWCEQPYRAGWRAMRGAIGQHSPELLLDIAGIRIASVEQIDQWDRQIRGGTRYVPNPEFASAPEVVVGDGDWIVGDTLIDCKTGIGLSVSKLRDYLYQLIGYVLMDGDDDLKIRNVAVWLPRYGRLPTWSLSNLLSADAEAELPRVRAGFRDALRGKSISIYEPVTAKRAGELLADNLLTATGGLDLLKDHEEVSVRRRTARNPNTDPTTLAALGTDPTWSVRAVVAGNIRTPPRTLTELTWDRSAVVRAAAANNPSTPRVALETLLRDPNWIVRWTLAERNSEVEDGAASAEDALSQTGTIHPKPPRGGFSSVVHSTKARAEDERLQWTLLRLVLLPDVTRGDFLRNLRPLYAANWEELPEGRLLLRYEWRTPQVVEDPKALARIRSDLAILATDPEPWIRAEVAGFFDPDPKTLARLGADRDDNVRYLAARRIILSGEVAALTRYALDDDPEIRAFVAAQVRAPVEVLLQLASDRDQSVRLCVARNPATPPEKLEVMSRAKPDAYSFNSFQFAVAGNPSAPTAALVRLAKGSDEFVLAAVAANPNTPLDVLDRLAGLNGRPQVRAAVASNSSASEEMLMRLAKDSHPDVREAVAENPNTPPRVADRLSNAIERRKTQTDVATIDRVFVSTIAERLERDQRKTSRADLNDRRASALGAETRDAMIKAISDTRREVRIGVALNPEATAEVLAFLVGDRSVEVRRAAASNLRIPPVLVDFLAGDADDDVRRAIAYNPVTDSDTLHRLAQDEATLVRASVAMNRSAPRELVEALAGSDDLLVARLAETFLD